MVVRKHMSKNDKNTEHSIQGSNTIPSYNEYKVAYDSNITVKAKPFKETKIIDTNNLIGEFNPEMNEGVHLIKAKSQELVNLIEKHCPDDTLGIKRLAILKILEAQMLSVKLFF